MSIPGLLSPSQPLLLIAGGLAASKVFPGLGKLAGLAAAAYGVSQLVEAQGVTEGLAESLGTTAIDHTAPDAAFQVDILEPSWQEAVTGPGMSVTLRLRNPWTQPVAFEPVVTVIEEDTRATARAVAPAIVVEPGTQQTHRMTVDVGSLPLQGTVFGVLGGSSTITIEASHGGKIKDRRVAVLVS